MSLATEFTPVHDGHIRLAVLQLLNGQPGYHANDAVLSQAVNAMGLTCTGDQMRNHLAWLGEQRLVTLLDAGSFVVATLTERGSEAARGLVLVKGVQRPAPGG